MNKLTSNQQHELALEKARNAWLMANDAAVSEAQKCVTKTGFNPPLEKPWAKWDVLRKEADAKWHEFYNLCRERVL